MSALNIEKTIVLDDISVLPNPVGHLCIAHEPSSEVVQYYMEGGFAGDKSCLSLLHEYEDLQFDNVGTRLTRRSVTNIGIKSFPGIGALGFFTYKHNDSSQVMAPINEPLELYDAPVISVSAGTLVVDFTIAPPEGITYSCYRITLRLQDFAYEYITYETTLQASLPEVKGTYAVTCIGYIDEGSAISSTSEIVDLIITTGRDTFAPIEADIYYTKEEIQNLLAALG